MNYIAKIEFHARLLSLLYYLLFLCPCALNKVLKLEFCRFQKWLQAQG